MEILKEIPSQFHYGSIEIQRLETSVSLLSSLNSIMVRLKS